MTLLSLRFSAFEVTLSGVAGGEYLPLPRSKALRWRGFPLLLTLGGCPTSFANFAHEQQCHPETEETPQVFPLDITLFLRLNFIVKILFTVLSFKVASIVMLSAVKNFLFGNFGGCTPLKEGGV